MARFNKDAKYNVAYAAPETIIRFPPEKDLPKDIRELADYQFEIISGGLGIVTGSKFQALREAEDMNAFLFVPNYTSQVEAELNLNREKRKQLQFALEQQGIHLVNHRVFRDVEFNGSRSLMYKNTPTTNNDQRSIAFGNRVGEKVQFMKELGLNPIVWGNDWNTAFVLANARALGLKTIYTAHNILSHSVHDSVVNHSTRLPFTELQKQLYYEPGLTGNIDLQATGLLSDYITTVSPGYRDTLLDRNSEINVPPYILDLFQKRAEEGRFEGIINPLTHDRSPLIDTLAECGIEKTDEIRIENRRKVSQELGIEFRPEVPLLVHAHRLDDQKSPDFFLSVIERIAKERDVQVLIMGDENIGSTKYSTWAGQIAMASQGQIAFREFNRPLELRAVESANAYGSMTPKREPCGTANILYLYLGAPVAAHAIDGPRDTISQINFQNNTGSGAPFSDLTYEAYSGAIETLVKLTNLPRYVKYGHLDRIARKTESLYKGANKEALQNVVRKTANI